MPNNADSTLLASLRQSIEALALEVALRDLSSPERIQPLVPMLAQIRRQAESAGMTAVAETASILPDTEPALRDALSRMQQLLAEPEPPALPTSLNQDPELVGDFIMESREHLSAIEAQLLALEQGPRNTEAINTIFRGLHTIKGLAGFLEFLPIQRFAHEVETLLDLARNLKVPVDSALVDIIRQSADHMTQCLRGVETGLEPASDAAPLVARIREMIDGTGDGTGNAPGDLGQRSSAGSEPVRTPAANASGNA